MHSKVWYSSHRKYDPWYAPKLNFVIYKNQRKRQIDVRVRKLAKDVIWDRKHNGFLYMPPH